MRVSLLLTFLWWAAHLLHLEAFLSISTPRSILQHSARRSSSWNQPHHFSTTTSVLSSLNEESYTEVPSKAKTPADSYDVIVVGSGIGGLCSAAMLSKYGYSVAVLESHSVPGGAAHGFLIREPKIGDFYFDTGPSFFSGLNPKIPAKASNPLRCVLDAIGEEVDCVPYATFGLKFPEGDFIHTTGFGKVGGVLEEVEGGKAVENWARMMANMDPLAQAVDALPTAALRSDLGTALTAAPYLSDFLSTAASNPLQMFQLTKPFQSILQSSGISSPSFTQNWLDLLCFCLSGLKADGTITAEMAMMMGEFYDEGATMDCPKGGAKEIVNALVRGIEKTGGHIFLNSHVDQVVIENGKVEGVRLKKKGKMFKAREAVISNLSVWDLYGSGIVPQNSFPTDFVQDRMATPVGKSFMHLHVGFKMSQEELQRLQAHYMYVDDWSRGIEAEDNAVLLSIPSVHDRSLAPEGYAVLHIYTPATEEYELWDGLDRKSEEYESLKKERCQYLWQVLESVIPDIRSRAVVERVGTPLTHERFLRRYRGSYGPAIRAGDASFPFPKTPIRGLLCCGDSCFPGIGVPAAAGSGVLAANSVNFASVKPQMKLLETMRTKN